MAGDAAGSIEKGDAIRTRPFVFPHVLCEQMHAVGNKISQNPV